MVEAIVGNKKLQLINFYGNHLGNISVERIIKCLIGNGHPIKCINFEKNCFDRDLLEKSGVDLSNQRFKL